MAVKATDKGIEVVKDKKRDVCQYCKGHTNNPSYCHEKGLWTPRKATCDDFKRRKK